MIDARLTKTADYFDLLLENGNFTMAEDGTQAAQHAVTRLLFFLGEWELNTDAGTDWYGIIWDMSKSRAEKELEIKSRILATPGIRRIQTFTWTQAAHTVTITGIVETDWGDVDISQEITAL